jgi:hypothetical protein
MIVAGVCEEKYEINHKDGARSRDTISARGCTFRRVLCPLRGLYSYPSHSHCGEQLCQLLQKQVNVLMTTTFTLHWSPL